MEKATKDYVLGLLEQNRGEPVSGARIARELSISRTAVWKSIDELRNAGYEISASTNKGYCLVVSSDILSVQGIRSCIKDQSQSWNIHFFETVESTNDTAKTMAIQGSPGDTVVVAETQTKGKGRRGRSFFSPDKSGVYMTVLLRPQDGFSVPDEAVFLTTAAAVAAARAIEKVTGKYVEIKWVNDLYLGGRKICGILTEGITNLETGTIDSVVIGIGINLFAPEGDFPEEIANRAASLLGSKSEKPDSLTVSLYPSRNRLIAAVLDELTMIRNEIPTRGFIKEYKERSCVIGKAIQVISPTTTENAYARDIDQDGGLVVQYADGRQSVLRSGEISIRF